MSLRRFITLMGAGLAALLLITGAEQLLAHCDGLDGPVVQAARRALDSGNLNLALVWVQPADEEEVRAAFTQTLSVRRLGPEAAALADRSFFETLVRLHRAGEGAAYTGLRPGGRDLGPAIPAADRALETDNIAALETLLITEIREGLREHLDEVRRHRGYDPDNVAAGRAFVRAYVEYIHYVERLHEDAVGAASGHYAAESR